MDSIFFQIALCSLAALQLTYVDGSCRKESGRDIDGGGGLSPVHNTPEGSCCGICAGTGGCKAYAWNDYMGGTCWLKTSTGPVINKSGVTIGILEGSVTTGTGGCSGGPHCFTFHNACPFTVWVGALGTPLPENGGWQMNSGSTKQIGLARKWNGRFWGRTECNGGKCVTGDCGGREQCAGAGGNPPATLAEFTLDGHAGLDFYDVSLVDGYNLPMRINVEGDHDPSSGNRCVNAGCNSDLNDICPDELRVWHNGNTVACKSACARFNTDEYCCRGAHNQPSTCPPTRFSKVFKQACPQAYSYAYDDESSTFTCKGSATGYKIIFCP